MLTKDDSPSGGMDDFVQKIVKAARQQGFELNPAVVAARLDTLRVMNELLKTQTTLIDVFKDAEDTSARIQRLQALANSHGMQVDHDSLEELLGVPEDGKAATELSDDELAGVAGGSNPIYYLVTKVAALFGQLLNTGTPRPSVRP